MAAPDPNKIEIGDTVNIIDGRGLTTIGVVVALPTNTLNYWIMRTPAPNSNLFYVSLYTPILQLVKKA